MTVTMDRKIIEKEIEEYNRGNNDEGCCCLLKTLDDIKDLIDKKGIDDDNTLKKLVKGSHQKHMQGETVKKAIDILSENKEWTEDFDSFEALYDVIFRLLFPIKGIGTITVYDTSLRIGYCKGILPIDYVYLARGAMIGARYLYGKDNLGKDIILGKMKTERILYADNNLKGLNSDLKNKLAEKLKTYHGNRIKTDFFKKVFNNMDSMNIENILCTNFYELYKKANKNKSK